MNELIEYLLGIQRKVKEADEYMNQGERPRRPDVGGPFTPPPDRSQRPWHHKSISDLAGGAPEGPVAQPRRQMTSPYKKWTKTQADFERELAERKAIKGRPRGWYRRSIYDIPK